MPPMVPGGSFHPQSKNVYPAVRGPRGEADLQVWETEPTGPSAAYCIFPEGAQRLRVPVDTKPSFLQEESRSVPSFKWRRWDLTDGAVTDSLFPMQRAQVQSLVRELDLCHS